MFVLGRQSVSAPQPLRVASKQECRTHGTDACSTRSLMPILSPCSSADTLLLSPDVADAHYLYAGGWRWLRLVVVAMVESRFVPRTVYPSADLRSTGPNRPTEALMGPPYWSSPSLSAEVASRCTEEPVKETPLSTGLRWFIRGAFPRRCRYREETNALRDETTELLSLHHWTERSMSALGLTRRTREDICI